MNLPVLFCSVCRCRKAMEWSPSAKETGVDGPFEARCVRCKYTERYVTPDDVLWLHETAMNQKT